VRSVSALRPSPGHRLLSSPDDRHQPLIPCAMMSSPGRARTGRPGPSRRQRHRPAADELRQAGVVQLEVGHVPGRRFSTSTSARRMSRRNASFPPADLRSSAASACCVQPDEAGRIPPAGTARWSAPDRRRPDSRDLHHVGAQVASCRVQNGAAMKLPDLDHANPCQAESGIAQMYTRHALPGHRFGLSRHSASPARRLRPKAICPPRCDAGRGRSGGR